MDKTIKFEKQAGVPAFTATEFAGRTRDYVLLVPEINEGDRLIRELNRMKKHGIADHVDIVLLDSGSTDGSTEPERLKRLGVNTLLITLDPGRQSAAFRMGFYWALKRGYEGILTVDGNNKDSVEDVPCFIEKLKEGYDFVQGSRFLKGGAAVRTPFIRVLGLRFVHAPAISLIARCRFTDTLNAFRAYSARYLRDPRVKPLRDIFKGYIILPYLSVRATQIGLRSCEIPVRRVYPKSGPVPTKIHSFGAHFGLVRDLIPIARGDYNP